MKTFHQVLKAQPHLRLCNINGVSKRLLERTNGECFIAFNAFSGNYELHSILSFDCERNSCNAVIPDSWLNWRIIEDYLINNHRKNAQELQDGRDLLNHYLDRQENNCQFMQTTGRLGIVKRTLGRTV